MSDAAIDREAVERLARQNETRIQTRPHAPMMTISEPEPLGVETAGTLRALRAALDAAEARERAAWEAVKAIEALRDEAQAEIEKNARDFMPSRDVENLYLGRKIGLEMALAAIRALSDTDALAEYVERVRVGERERASQKLLAIIAKHKAMSRTKGTYPRLTEDIAAAIRQEASDG
jgi:hypothetical protein